MSNIKSRSFLMQWVTAVTGTMILATMGAFISMWSVGELVQQAWGDVAMALVVGAIFGGLLGVGVGLGQAAVVRSQGIPFLRWFGRTALAAAVGMMIGFTLMFSFFDVEALPEVATGIAMALALGLPIGLVQAQMLKAQTNQANLWIPICIAAFFISFTVGLPLSGEGREWLSIGVVALLTAVLTGIGMVWLARNGETAVAV